MLVSIIYVPFIRSSSLQIAKRDEAYAPETLLDFGSGLGTVEWYVSILLAIMIGTRLDFPHEIEYKCICTDWNF